jgi:hypothetical protein
VSLGAAGNAARDEKSGTLTELLGANGKNFPAGGKFTHKKPV